MQMNYIHPNQVLETGCLNLGLTRSWRKEHLPAATQIHQMLELLKLSQPKNFSRLPLITTETQTPSQDIRRLLRLSLHSSQTTLFATLSGVYIALVRQSICLRHSMPPYTTMNLYILLSRRTHFLNLPHKFILWDFYKCFYLWGNSSVLLRHSQGPLLFAFKTCEFPSNTTQSSSFYFL